MIKQILDIKDSIIVLTDPHGCYKTLVALLAKLPKGVPIAFCGDLIDRGPGSAQIIKLIRENGYLTIKGNHEILMVDFFKGKDNSFIQNGGYATIESYPLVDGNRVVSKDDLEWMESLPVALEFPNLKNSDGDHLLVTHSSAHSVWGKLDQIGPKRFENELTWNRLPKITKIPGIFNIFGHTVQKNGPRIRTHYANIDTGAVFGGEEGFGVLSAIQFPEMTVYRQENIEKVETNKEQE